MDEQEIKSLREIDEAKYRIPIEELKLGSNYKDVKRESIDKLKRSLLDDDQLLPILTDARVSHEGVIIGGYHQYFAIKELIEEGKWKHGDRVWIEPRLPKDDKHAKILALKHNTQYDIATTERLAEYAADLIDSDYLLSDIPVITDYQTISLMDVMDRVGPGPEVVEDEPPKVSDEEPTSKLGEVYQLGRHRLMCGDSTKIEDVEKLMNGQKADMVFTDPPYALFGNSTGVAGIVDDKMIRPFFRDIFNQCKRFTKKFGHIYVCCDWHSAFVLESVARDVELTAKNMCIWYKGGGGVGGMYTHTYEIVWFFANSPISRTTMGHGESGERTINGVPNVWEVHREKEGLHNAQKPVEMISIPVKASADENENVLDLFGGSGSTLIACEQLDRTCYMMEIDPKYCDVIRKRYAKFIGKEDTWTNETPLA